MVNPRVVVALAAFAALAGCERNPLQVTRSACPAVAVPYYAGEVTRFNPATSRDASAIDVSAQLTEVRGACADVSGRDLTSDVRFKVVAQRRDARAAQDVYLPVFVALVQGGNVLVSKQLTGVQLRFAAGQRRAEADGGAQAFVARSAVLLPAEINEKITRERRPEDADALTDPLADPATRAAVRARTFEVLVGFQLDDPSLAYNVGK